MQKISLTCLLTMAVLVGMAQAKKPAPAKTTKATGTAPVLKNALDSMSYAIGILDANFFKQQGMEKVNSQLVARAYQDVIDGKKPLMTLETCDMTVREQLQAFVRQKAKVVIDEGEKFLSENKKKEGVKTTPSGLQYEVITMGTGAKPVDSSVVKVHYEGFLTNGTKFESSRDRGEPLVYPLYKLIPGWVEGITMMPVGSRFKLYIPYQLGYGERCSPPAIPGGSALIFDVELLDIVK